jgi:glucose-1-phosphate cytidylyltransferase
MTKREVAPKVIILCGGKGHRLRPLTARLPKPMVELNGKPILQHIIEFYIGKGFARFVLCTGFCAGVIEDFVASHSFGAEIELSDAGERAGMLERIHRVRGSIDERAIVTYGDTFIHNNPRRLLKAHAMAGNDLTITVADIRSPFGLVGFDARKKATVYDEKPVFSYYIGQMVVERSLLESLARRFLSLPDGDGLVALFQALIRKRRLGVYRHSGLHITFNTLYERDRAEEKIIEYFTEQEEQR